MPRILDKGKQKGFYALTVKGPENTQCVSANATFN